jgi:hypothetical protein
VQGAEEGGMRKVPAWAFPTGGALLAFLVSSALPVWSVWHINPWVGVCYYGKP